MQTPGSNLRIEIDSLLVQSDAEASTAGATPAAAETQPLFVTAEAASPSDSNSERRLAQSLKSALVATAFVALFAMGFLAFSHVRAAFHKHLTPNTPELSEKFQHVKLENLKVRILSYNIFIRPPGIHNKNGDFKDERLQEFVSGYLDKYDVVALQEMFQFGSSRVKTLLEAAKKRGFLYQAVSPGGWIDSGLVIISRFPIESFDFQKFPRGIYADRLCGKGVLHARILLADDSNATVDFFTTHLQSSAQKPAIKEEIDVRKQQLKVLHDFVRVKTRDSPSNIVIIAGDLNIDACQKLQDFEYLRSLFFGSFSDVNVEQLDQPTFGVGKGCLKAHPHLHHAIPNASCENSLVKPEDVGTCQQIDHILLHKPANLSFCATSSINQLRAKGPQFTHLSGINFCFLFKPLLILKNRSFRRRSAAKQV